MVDFFLSPQECDKIGRFVPAKLSDSIIFDEKQNRKNLFISTSFLLFSGSQLQNKNLYKNIEENLLLFFKIYTGKADQIRLWGCRKLFADDKKVIDKERLSRRNGVWHFSAYTVVLNFSVSLPVHQ